jgi:hypothetical protein
MSSGGKVYEVARAAQITMIWQQLTFFPSPYLLFIFLEIHARSVKNQSCHPIYFVFQL